MAEETWKVLWKVLVDEALGNGTSRSRGKVPNGIW